MAKRSGQRRKKKKRSKAGGHGDASLLRRAIVALVCLLAVAVWNFFGDAIKLRAGLPTPAVPDKRDALRVVTWNLENFPGEHQDLDGLRAELLELDADLIAVQEIKDPQRLAELFPEYALALSDKGGRGHQRLGFLYDPQTIMLSAVQEHEALSMGGHVRPMLTAYVQHRGDGPDFHAAVVHLKAMPAGYELRREQWPTLRSILRALPDRGPGRGDLDLMALGDFNVVGDEDGTPTPSTELRQLEEILGEAGLHRVEAPAGCSAYWDGKKRDAWKEPSLLDFVWVAGFAANSPTEGSEGWRLRVGTHCGQHACQAFRSTEAYPELTYEDLSDHCPLVLDLPLVDRDP